MPERAEVLVAAAHADTVGRGRLIETLTITHCRTTRAQPISAFAPFVGTFIRKVSSVGKWIVVEVDGVDDAIGIHLRMSGHLIAARPGTPHPDRHVHGVLGLGQRTVAPPADHRVPRPPPDGAGLEAGPTELWFRDPRTFGEWRVLPGGVVPGAPDVLGESPTGGAAASLVRSRSVAIKPALLDQRLVVAGIGSYLADEALHAVGVDPRMPARALRPKDWDELLVAAAEIAGRAALAGGVSLVDEGWSDAWGRLGEGAELLRVHARKRCRTCGVPTRHVVLGSRGARWCPSCQRRGSRTR